jgi:hypothetical protein
LSWIGSFFTSTSLHPARKRKPAKNIAREHMTIILKRKEYFRLLIFNLLI